MQRQINLLELSIINFFIIFISQAHATHFLLTINIQYQESFLIFK